MGFIRPIIILKSAQLDKSMAFKYKKTNQGLQMEIIVYHAPNTRGNQIIWALEELGLQYQISWLNLEKQEHKTPEYLKIHPFGKVPAIKINGQVIFETGAILLALGDLMGTSLVPPISSPLRAHYYRWMIYKESVMSLALLEKIGAIQSLNPTTFGGGDMTQVLDHLSAHLAQNQYMLGDEFSLVDIGIASTFGWARWMKAIPDHYTKVLAYTDLCTGRAACKRMGAINAEHTKAQ